MFVAKAKDMREIDKRAIEKYKIPGIVLMENASMAVLKRIEELKLKKITIVCGTGNNGGDGFALARLLINKDFKVDVFCFGSLDKISGDAKVNLEILKEMGIKIESQISELRNSIEVNDLVVDALLGTGITRDVSGIYLNVINIINELSKYTISIDIPSGIDSDSGKKLGNCVIADETITFGCIKYGHVLKDGREATGRLFLDGISIPKKCIEEQKLTTTTNFEKYPLSLIKVRGIHTNKGNYGKVYILGGSHLMSGAVILSSKAAIRSGSGLVTCVVPESILDRVGVSVIEATYLTSKEEEGKLSIPKLEIDNILNKADVIAFGMGMGVSEKLTETLGYLIDKTSKPLLIDADGINMLKNIKDKLKGSKGRIVITPHPGEMSRLTGLSIDYIIENSLEVAQDFAREYGVILLLKGASTIVTDGYRTYINTSGNPGMASGGSGDVLSGIIASFIGQGYDEFDASVLGSFFHGRAGDEAFKAYGYGLKAEDITDFLWSALKE